MNSIQRLRIWITSPEVMETLSKPGFMKWPIAGFIIVNMITWPVFIMCDRKTPIKDRAYSAERQFFQEILSLGCHLGITGIFEQLGAKMGSKLFPQDFRTASSALPEQTYDLIDWSSKTKLGWQAACRNNTIIGRQIRSAVSPEAIQLLKQQLVPISSLIRGSIRAGSTIGSLISLVIIAPWINNMLLPYFLRGVDSILSLVTRRKLKLPSIQPVTLRQSIKNTQSDALRNQHYSPLFSTGYAIIQKPIQQATKRSLQPFTYSKNIYPSHFSL